MTFHTHDLPARDRFPCWFEMATRTHVRAWGRSEHEDDFAATMRVWRLGEVQVSLLSYPSLQVARTLKLIRENDPEMYLLDLNLNGSAGLTYRGRSTLYRAGEFAFCGTSHPSQGWRSSQEEPARSLVVQFPRALPGLAADSVDRLAAVPICTRRGIGAVLAAHLSQLMRDTDGYTGADETALSGITLDLVAATLAHRLDASDALTPETHLQVLLQRIDHFIELRLSDPELSPEVIAAAHHISLRYLHRLFQARGGPTVRAHIRQARLERCRRDLTDPRLDGLPLHMIAARWGFGDRTHFSRLFRSAYGVSPGDYRHTRNNGG
ncbi:helix-turn-helix domain-containing protein [Streptosporangium amethystogenes subsp. fukuiense]|uniref:Helix-turn-helix domain-containing protein n=1 Tax=Streptosporangium amethystogenes subsp. fukuiense TaxID=698418 RepID=A0ABW2TC59_9ACTN